MASKKNIKKSLVFSDKSGVAARSFLFFLIVVSCDQPSRAGLYDLMSEKSYDLVVGKCAPLSKDTINSLYSLSEKCGGSPNDRSLHYISGELNKVAEESFFQMATSELRSQYECDASLSYSYLDFQEKRKKLVQDFKAKVPVLKELKRSIGSLAGSLQVLNGQVPKNLNGLNLSKGDRIKKENYETGQQELKRLSAAYEAILASLPLGSYEPIRDLVSNFSENDLKNDEVFENKITQAYKSLAARLQKDAKSMDYQSRSKDGFDRKLKESIIQDPHFFDDFLSKYSTNPEELKNFRCQMDAKYGTGTRIMDGALLAGSLLTTKGASLLSGPGRAVAAATLMGRARSLISSTSARILRASAIGLASVTAYREIDKECLSSAPLTIQSNKNRIKNTYQCENNEAETRVLDEGNCVLTVALSALGMSAAKNMNDTGFAGLARYLSASAVNKVITVESRFYGVRQELLEMFGGTYRVSETAVCTVFF